ncbi:hypothetical protein BGX28_007837 [Mortierella sp. GBA30]|nr:hypothetical protein BGX28_007837 [Mortierella sp. GBA30]
MTSTLASVYPKVRSWLASVASPSSTHASGMLIILGILAAVTDAESVKEPIRVHHPKVSSSRPGQEKRGTTDEGADAKQINNQEMLYYVAMGMLVSQGLIRLITFISSRREAAALARQKKDDDLLLDTSNGKKKKSGLSLNALEDLDEETLKQKRREHLATLGDNATLLESDSEDEDYEQTDEEESSSEEEEEEEIEEEEEEEEVEEEEESEGEIERRRRVLAEGDAEIEE